MITILLKILEIELVVLTAAHSSGYPTAPADGARYHTGMDLVGAALILLIGIPVALAAWFGVLWLRQVVRAALLHRSRDD